MKQLCKCRGDKPGRTGYTKCDAIFVLDESECCPKCGGENWYEIDLSEPEKEQEEVA